MDDNSTIHLKPEEQEQLVEGFMRGMGMNRLRVEAAVAELLMGGDVVELRPDQSETEKDV